MSAPDAYDDMIEEAERCFRDTENPLWAWKVVSICLGRYSGDGVCRPMLDWVQKYLGDAACDFLAIGNKRVIPKLTDELVLKALKFKTRSGRNQFSLYKSAVESLVLAIASSLLGREKTNQFASEHLNLQFGAADRRVKVGKKIRPRLSLIRPEGEKSIDK